MFVWPFAVYKVCSLSSSPLGLTVASHRQGLPSFNREEAEAGRVYDLSKHDSYFEGAGTDPRSSDSGDHTS